jgi:uncharacterized protein
MVLRFKPKFDFKFGFKFGFIGALCFGFLLTGGAFLVAQAEPALAPPEPATAHLAAARQLVVLSGMSRSFTAVVPQTMSRLTTTFTQTRPEIAHDLDIVLAELKPEFDKQADEIVDTAAHLFARLMSEPQLQAADAFFESEAGKKYVEIQPAFFGEILPAMQNWQQKLAQDMVTRVREEMKKKGHEL